jgi:hypothetical protein
MACAERSSSSLLRENLAGLRRGRDDCTGTRRSLGAASISVLTPVVTGLYPMLRAFHPGTVSDRCLAVSPVSGSAAPSPITVISAAARFTAVQAHVRKRHRTCEAELIRRRGEATARVHAAGVEVTVRPGAGNVPPR